MDFNNRQLAEIISQTSEKIASNVLKERKISNDLDKTTQQFAKLISELQMTKIEPDLRDLNKFYEEKTAENIKRVNSHLSVPNLAAYIWVASVVLFLCSGIFIYLSTKSKQQIITEYQQQLSQDGYMLIKKEDKTLFDQMDIWFRKNPSNKQSFVNWREQQKK